MSHFAERTEKDCLNCGAVVQGRYCHICGQENVEPRESFWHLVLHFIYDITHFDGKFFSTLNLLFFKPGFLSREYMMGRRASYLNPIRMYIFTSAFFFLIFFKFFFQVEEKQFKRVGSEVQLIQNLIDDTMNVDIRNGFVVIGKDSFGNILNEDERYRHFLDSLRKRNDSRHIAKVSVREKKAATDTGWGETIYETRVAYDSAQKTLPERLRDGWFEKVIIYRNLEIEEEYGGNAILFLAMMTDKFIHFLPTIMFISLPILALIIKLLYVRKKQFYYVNHLVFGIHFYIFAYLMMLLFFAFTKVNRYNPSIIWDVLRYLVFFLILFYLYKAMRNFYKQGRIKTILKFLTLNFLSFLVSIILFSIFALYTAMYG